MRTTALLALLLVRALPGAAAETIRRLEAAAGPAVLAPALSPLESQAVPELPLAVAAEASLPAAAASEAPAAAFGQAALAAQAVAAERGAGAATPRQPLDRTFDGGSSRVEAVAAPVMADAAPAPRRGWLGAAARLAAAGTAAVLTALPAAALADGPHHAAAAAVSSGSAAAGAAALGLAAVAAGLILIRDLKRYAAAGAVPWRAPKPKRRILGRLALVAFVALGIASRGLTPSDRGLTRPRHVVTTPYPQRDIVVDGMRLRYIDVGQGPALLLIPGLSSRIEEMDAMTEALRGHFRVLVVDLPGTGYSDKPDREYSLQFYEDTLVHFLDALGVKRSFVAGGSLGGNLTLRLALRSPERFPRVVAWAPGASWESKPIVAAGADVMGGYAPYAFFWPIVKGQSTYWYSPNFRGREAALRDTFAYYEEVLSPGFVRMYWDLASEQMATSLQDTASRIRQPVLLVWGDQDDGGGMGDGVKALHKLIPGSRLVVFPGARHSLDAERPAELSAETLKFLSEDPDFNDGSR